MKAMVLVRPIRFDDSWAWRVQKEAKSRQKAQQQEELDAIVREMEADTRRKQEEQAAQKRDKAAQKQARKAPPSQPEPEPADDGFTVPEISMEAKVKARQDERLHSDRMAAMRQEQKDRERKIVETEVENAVRILCRFLCPMRRLQSRWALVRM